MAWNPSPKVAAARDIGKTFGKHQVVVLMIDLEEGSMEVATYGKTRELCAEARKIGDVAFDAVFAHLSSNVEHDRRTADLSPGVRVDGPVGPHTQEE